MLDQNVVYADQADGSGIDNSRYVGKRSTDLVAAQNLFDDVAGDISRLSRDTVGGSSKEATAELLAATWNVDLATDYGDAISKEAEA